MDTRRLRYFLQVADTGSFTGAAERLRIAQPALSKQVGILEHELGLKLFVRHGRGVTLTAAGELVRERAVAIIHRLDQLRDEVAEQVELPRGPVALGMPPTLRELITFPATCDFHARYPGARLRVVEANVVLLRDQAAAGHLDLAVVPDFESLQGLDVRPLVEEALCIIGPPGAGLDMKRPKPLRFLHRKPMIATSHPNSFRRQIERALGRQRVEVDVRLEADTLPLSLELIRACGLYAVMPASAVQTYLASDVIAATPVKGQKVSWMLVSLHERSRSTATRALAQLIEARCKSAIDEGAWMTARKSTNSLGR